MAYCDVELMRNLVQGQARRKTFMMFSSSDHISGATGKILTVYISKGGQPWVTPQGTVGELGFGRYYIDYTANDTDTLGDLGFLAMAADCDATNETDQVISSIQAEAEAQLIGLPVSPDADSLILEAFLRSGVPVPTEAQLRRAHQEWLEEIKMQIATSKRWHVLEDSATVNTIAMVQGYDIPAPLNRILNMWVTNGSEARPLDGPNDGLRRDTLSTGVPHQWEEWEGRFYLWPVPDTFYPLTLRGEVDLALTDLNDARNIRLLREWRLPLLSGLMQRIREDQDDAQAAAYAQLTDKNIVRAMIHDSRKRQRLHGAGWRSPGGLPRWRTV